MPGSAEKIIDAQIISPQRRLDDVTRAEIDTAKNGQGWAIFLAVACITLAAIFFAHDNNIAGGAFLGLPLTLLIGSFLPAVSRRPKGEKS